MVHASKIHYLHLLHGKVCGRITVELMAAKMHKTKNIPNFMLNHILFTNCFSRKITSDKVIKHLISDFQFFWELHANQNKICGCWRLRAISRGLRYGQTIHHKTS